MIGRLRGTIGYKSEDHALIDVGGVGYIVYCSARTLNSLPVAGGAALVYTELLVREDLLQLFGFSSILEREWHRLLVQIPGVGAKASLSILGALGPEGVGRALTLGDADSLRRAPGVGPKLAQRIANELKDKAPAVLALGAQETASTLVGADTDLENTDSDISSTMPEDASLPASVPKPRKRKTAKNTEKNEVQAAYQRQADAISALVNLGYDTSQAATAVTQVADQAQNMTEIIRLALRSLAPKE